MTTTAIKRACEDGIFTHDDLVNEIKHRIAGNELLAGIFERGMQLAVTDEDVKTVMYLVVNASEECKEILATYLYYKMRK